MPRIPISTLARIRRDRWEQAASERFNKLVELSESDHIARLASDFAAKSGKGRARAHARLCEAFDPFGVVESEQLTGPTPSLFYSMIGAPSSDLFTALDTDPDLTETQRTGVAVNYLALGKLGGKVVVRGTWGCSLTNLALDTWFERSKSPGDLDMALLNAHRCLLSAPQRNIPLLLAHDVLLPVGGGHDGFFWSTPITSRSKEKPDAVLHVRLRAFLPDEMATAETIEQSAAVLKVGPGDELLVSGPLHPLHLWKTTTA
jgi:hypothetical protein